VLEQKPVKLLITSQHTLKKCRKRKVSFTKSNFNNDGQHIKCICANGYQAKTKWKNNNEDLRNFSQHVSQYMTLQISRFCLIQRKPENSTCEDEESVIWYATIIIALLQEISEGP
jgi:hypothetical protein